VNAKVPLVMDLDDAAAALAAVGGKAASLARLTRAGFPVPPGFCVTTRAYLDYVAHGDLREPVTAAMSAVDVSDPGTFETASRRIAGPFAERPVPPATAAAIAEAYGRLGDDVAVAVRSSATAEDLPGMSSAGQHDTYLNIRGADDVLDAVKRCWASLWTPRAIGYRTRYGTAADEVSLAVVVQQFLPADAAGVLFTVDPVGRAPGRVVVNANWGLGETVVGGTVTPDVVVVDRASGGVVDYRVGGKEVMTVAAGTGTREQDTPAGQRGVAVLSAAEAGELARAGLAIEKLYGEPVDVEWARAGHQLFILQARPITGPAAAGPVTSRAGEQWNDSLDGYCLWTSGNLGEAIPDVMTPATWSFMQLFMTRAIAPPSVPGYHGYGRVGGRFYMNVSMSVSLFGAVGVPARRYVALSEPVFGKLPAAGEIPRVSLPRWKVIRLTLPITVTLLRRARRNGKRLPAWVAGAASRCDALRAEIQRIQDPGALAEAWPASVEPFFLEASDMLAATGARGVVLLTVPGKLAALIGETDATLLLSGQRVGGTRLASLGPVAGLVQLARGEIDRMTFDRRYGHRGPHEIEVFFPRPAEDAGWIDHQLAGLWDATHAADDLLARQEAARAAVWERLERQQPKQVAKVRAMVTRWAAVARAREEARSELARSFWVLRAWVLRAGELTGHGDDLFFLSLPEILDVLRGGPSPLAAVPGRKATYETYRALPPYPALICGRFDPVRWAADPDRRTDLYDERAAMAPPGDTVTGFAGASGVVEGVARLIGRPEDAGQLGDGEILVTTVTNIGWTPIFPRAAAVVTDVGAPLSHAAIVARELGIPAVVGCRNATMRLHSGDRIRVDGGKGTVEILHRA
jgi:phosphohistidine swiveling domain-containing protein